MCGSPRATSEEPPLHMSSDWPANASSLEACLLSGRAAVWRLFQRCINELNLSSVWRGHTFTFCILTPHLPSWANAAIKPLSIISHLLIKKRCDSFHPPYLQVDAAPTHGPFLPEHFSSRSPFTASTDSELCTAPTKFSPFIARLQDRASIHSQSMKRKKMLKPSSHGSINADVLWTSRAVIKGCQSGNYLLLSGLPEVILLKPSRPHFICSLCEFLSVEPW